MLYWWVNHKQTARQEIEGGYLWSPFRTKDNRRNQFYENMEKAKPGDGILSFADGQIRYVGRVTEKAREGRKPAEYGPAGENWNNTGWHLPVEWTPLPRSVRPKAHIDEFRQWLPKKYSPIRTNGNGNQGAYLAEIPQSIFESVLGHGGADLRVWKGGGRSSTSTDRRGRVAENNTPYDAPRSDSEVEQKVRVRRGQGIFRVRVTKVEKNGCRLTGIQNPRLLRASHIKPWRDCTTYERLDGAHGFLLAPHVDHLFDSGYISFENSGRVRVSPRITAEELDRLGLANVRARNVGAFTDQQQVYLAHHREHVFKE